MAVVTKAKTLMDRWRQVSTTVSMVSTKRLPCDAQECYRARLTPKPWRMGDGDHHVCNLVDTIGSIVLPCFESQLAMHDEMTLARSHESSLA
jgi:hypothetical protein